MITCKWPAFALLVVALAVRLIGIDQLPRFDELYTLPAAQSMLAVGEPRIAGGIYDRAEIYTALLAGWFWIFGDSLVSARLLSTLFSVLLVIAVFWWTDAVASRTAAWIAGLFVALDPLSIEMSQFARFYALHAFLFWVGAIALYGVMMIPRRLGIALLTWTAAAVLLALAYHLQMLTLIGGVGLGVWLAGFLVWRFRPGPWLILAGGAASVLVLAILVGVAGDALAAMIARYLKTPLTVLHHRGEVWFYHMHLIERYPSVWPLLPFLAVLAVATRPKPALFALCVFGVAFTLLSFAGHKSWHLFYFAMPFLFVIWAIAIAAVWRAIATFLTQTVSRVAAPLPLRLQRPFTAAAAVGCIAFLVLSNGAPARTLLRPLGVQLGEGFSAGWPASAAQLRQAVAEVDIVVTSHELHMLHYFGRADITLSKERLAEVADQEFARDPRTGLPTISRASSLELVMSCYPSGLIVTDTIKGWRAPTVIDDDVSTFIAAHTVPVALPEGSGIKAFRWDHPVGADLGCIAIPGYRA